VLDRLPQFRQGVAAFRARREVFLDLGLFFAGYGIVEIPDSLCRMSLCFI
jgi:hypothetical protein